MNTPIGTTPPYPDDQYQNNFEKSNDAWNQTSALILQDNDDIQSALAKMDDLAQGDWQKALLYAILAVFLMVLQKTQHKGLQDMQGEAVSSDLGAMISHIQQLWSKGADAVLNNGTITGGMSTDDAEVFFQEYSDVWFDLNGKNPDGTKFTQALDDGSIEQLSDSITTLLKTFSINADPNSNLPRIIKDGQDDTDLQIAGATNTMWTGGTNSTKEAPNPDMTSCIDEFQMQTNTLNAITQGINGEYQTDNNTANAMMGSISDCMGNEISQISTSVTNFGTK
jgi:hypothetical protein